MIEPAPAVRPSKAEAGAAIAGSAVTTREGDVRILRVVVLLVFGTVAAVLLGAMLWPFLPALVTSVVLVVLALPAHRRIRAWCGMDRVAAFISTLLVVLVILVPIFAVSIVALQDLSAGVTWLETQLRTGFPVVNRVVQWSERMLAGLGLGNLNIQEQLSQRAGDISGLVVGRTFRVVSGVGGIALQIGVGLFTLFYLFKDGSRMLERGKGLVPLPSGPTELLIRRTHEVIFAAVFGHVFVAMVQGLLGGLMFWALGIPTPAVWGVLMGALSMIPMIGPAFVWLPAGAVLIATGSTVRGVILLVFGALVISTIDNVIRAVLVSGRARVHPLVVFFGVLGGVLLFGAVGILVGPVLIVAAAALMEMGRLALFPDEASAAAAAAKAEEAAAAREPPAEASPAGS